MPCVLAGARFILEKFGGIKLEVPQVASVSPSEGGSDLDREVGRFDFVPDSEFVQNWTDGRKLTLSDVVAGKLFSFENEYVHAWPVLLQK